MYLQPVKGYENGGNIIGTFDTINSASDFTEIHPNVIYNICMGDVSSYKNTTWKFLEGPDVRHWKWVENFPNYKISKTGIVYSAKARRTINPQMDKYKTIRLRSGKKQSRRGIHTLVAEAYIPNPDELSFVVHKNDDFHDNRIGNLKWSSVRSGSKHRQKRDCSQRVRQLSLDNEIINEFISAKKASEETGINVSGIRRACSGERKSAGGCKWEYI